MIGCASHRFSLAVSDNVADKPDIIYKVQALMTKLRTLKLSTKLRQHTHSKPVIYCVTRWSSMADMLNLYIEFKPVLVEHFSDDNNILLYVMSPVEIVAIDELVKDMTVLRSVTKALQRENIDLSSVRALFDETCRKFKNIDKENKYLGSNARVIKSRPFESGVVKILEQRENDLVLCEKIACARLKKIEGEPEIETHSDDNDFASMILKKRAKVTTSSDYFDLHFLLCRFALFYCRHLICWRDFSALLGFDQFETAFDA